MKKRSLTFIGLGLAFALIGCEQGPIIVPPPVGGSSDLSGVVLRDLNGKDTVSIQVNQSIRLRATGVDGSGSAMTNVTWTTLWSSGDTTIAVVDTTGQVTGLAGGNAWVFACIDPGDTGGCTNQVHSGVFRDSALVKVETQS